MQIPEEYHPENQLCMAITPPTPRTRNRHAESSWQVCGRVGSVVNLFIIGLEMKESHCGRLCLEDKWQQNQLYCEDSHMTCIAECEYSSIADSIWNYSQPQGNCLTSATSIQPDRSHQHNNDSSGLFCLLMVKDLHCTCTFYDVRPIA